MKDLLQNLIELQAIDFAETDDKNSEARAAELRATVPPQILGHYDRLVARGKKGIVALRNQICTGCHMQVPIGVVMTLRHGNDIQVCDSCGRYLYLVETTEPAEEPAKKTRRARKPAAPPVAAHAAAAH